MKVYYLLLISLFCSLRIHAQVGPSHSPEAAELNACALEQRQLGHYDTALYLANQALILAQSNNDSLIMAKSLNTLGIIYSSKGDPVQSMMYYEQSLELFRLLHNQDQISAGLLNLGIAYKIQGNYEKALSCLIEAAEWFEQEKNMKYVSSAYNTIGNILRIEKRYGKALEYHANALSIRQEIGNEKGIAGSLNNIGAVFMDLGNYDSALYYFNVSLKLKEITNLPAEKATSLSHIAEIYFLKKDYSVAEKYYNEVHEIYKLKNNKVGLAGSFFEIARLHFAQSANSLAEQEAMKALALSKETGASDIRLLCYDLLKNIYSTKSNFSKALYYAEQFIVLNDSILGKDKQTSLSNLEVKYESEKKQRELEQLSREQEKAAAIMILKDLQLESKTNYNKNLILTMVLLSMVILLLLLLFRDRSLFAKKLDTLLRELHHRVKNNFQVLLSLFSLQLATVEDEATKTLIEGNRNRITAMMLIHSGLYLDKDITRVRIGNYIQNLMDNLLVIYDLAPDSIRIEYDIDENLDIDVDKSIPLGLLINELATNALKYAFKKDQADPRLRIHFHRTKGQYHLLFEDNGPGLDLSIQKRSFGLKLAEAQAKQLKGILHSKNEQGLKYEIAFE